jgi:hypothetical protein
VGKVARTGEKIMYTETWPEDATVRGHFEDPAVDGRCIKWIVEKKGYDSVE